MIASDSQEHKDAWLVAFREYAPAAVPPAPPPAPESLELVGNLSSSSEVTVRVDAPQVPTTEAVEELSITTTTSSSAVPQSLTVGRKDLRAEIMNELVETEKAYVRDLNTVILVQFIPA